MTDERTQTALELLKEGLDDGSYADIMDGINIDVNQSFYQAIAKFAEDFASLKVAEATKEIKFPTHDEINKASMIFDKQKRPLWKEAIYRAGANWAIDWIKQNINK